MPSGVEGRADRFSGPAAMAMSRSPACSSSRIWRSNRGCPSVSIQALSWPIRVDRPPARITPAICSRAKVTSLENSSPICRCHLSVAMGCKTLGLRTEIWTKLLAPGPGDGFCSAHVSIGKSSGGGDRSRSRNRSGHCPALRPSRSRCRGRFAHRRELRKDGG